MFETIFILIVLYFSVVIHEIAHGSCALILGDDTAKREGRLTLNPIAHIDPIGTIFLPLILLILTFGQGPIFGWAKPVPVNPLNFRDKKWGIVKVSLAGPLTNLLIAIFFSFLAGFNFPRATIEFFEIISIYNFAWAFFNLLPLPPLDGFHILYQILPERFFSLKFFLLQYGFLILLFLIFFGLAPIFSFSQSLFNLISHRFFLGF
jgi:Zn-dependent protease